MRSWNNGTPTGLSKLKPSSRCASQICSINSIILTHHESCLMHRQHVSLKWKGHKELEADTDDKTIGELFDVHNSVPHRQVYFGNVKQNAAPTVHLEVFLDIAAVRYTFLAHHFNALSNSYHVVREANQYQGSRSSTSSSAW